MGLVVNCKQFNNCKEYINVGSVIPTPYILAGTSPSGYILESLDNGITFSNLGSLGYGNVTVMKKLQNGDILFFYDTVQIFNWSTSSYVSLIVIGLGGFPIRVVVQNSTGELQLPDDYGNVYSSMDNGLTWTLVYTLPSTFVFSGLSIGSDFYWFTSDGITRNNEGIFLQSGYFMSSMFDGIDTIYTGTLSGHIWKNTVAGNYNSWTDLGSKSFRDQITTITKLDSGRIIIGGGVSVSITDDLFMTMTVVSAFKTNFINIGDGIVLASSIVGVGDANLYRSTDNGSTWLEVTGNPQFNEANINCLINN